MIINYLASRSRERFFSAGLSAAIFIVVLLSSLPAAAQSGLSDASAMCNDLTPANRAMAKSAGYDIDALCNSLDSVVSSKSESRELSPIDPRDTVSSPSNRNYDDGDGRDRRYDQDDQGSRDSRDSSERLDNRYDRDDREASKNRDKNDRYDRNKKEKLSPKDDLKPFGYDLFAGEPNSFEPVTNIPVSPDYLLGPGDTLEILFYGKTNSALSLDINRDGSVSLPELGPLVLGGLTFSEAKEMLQTRIATQMIGVQASISLGELRSMQVFVLGEAYKPGAYTVSSLSTITHALFVSGGVSDIASLRNVQLKRSGKVVATLDLYDLLMRGDTSNDLRLQSLDVIYIPTVGDQVSVAGEVLRPAIYELKGSETAADLVALAGGLNPKAFLDSARIDRMGDDGYMTVMDVDLSQPAKSSISLRAGDHLQIDGMTDRKKMIVTLAGHVDHPGDFGWRKGLRVSDLVGSTEKLKPLTDLDFALLVRELSSVGEIETLRVDLKSVLQEPGGEADLELAPRDKLQLFSTDSFRFFQLLEIIESLKVQARSGELAKVVTISGSVKFPDEYPMTKAMTVQQLVAAAGGLAEGAYTQSVEINRIDLSDPNLATTRTLLVNLASAADDVSLQPYDSILVRAIPEYRETNTITLKGEVVFPGEYVFARGETLSEIIERAGGFTRYADVNAAFFTREALRLAEAENLAGLRDKMESELAAEQLNTSKDKPDASAMAMQEEALKKLESAEAIGRLVIPLQGIMDQREEDIILASGDELIIPQFRQEVTVIGEVQRPTSHMFKRDRKFNEYVQMSGGMKRTADKRQVYLVKASGEVVLPRSGWFKFNSNADQIGPGDTIVVPVDPDGRVKLLPLMGEVTKILYELSLGAAAINSFSSP